MNPSPHLPSDDSDATRRQTARQAPRLRDRLRKVLLDQGHPIRRVEQYVEWCKDFVVYHQRRPPEEMGAIEVEQYLRHVRAERGGAVEATRAALTALYRDVLGQAQALEPRLLERVRAVLRVRHYALRTEECYVQWIRRYILFHHQRHPVEMGGGAKGDAVQFRMELVPLFCLWNDYVMLTSAES